MKERILLAIGMIALIVFAGAGACDEMTTTTWLVAAGSCTTAAGCLYTGVRKYGW